MKIKTKFDIGQEVYYLGWNMTSGKRTVNTFKICSIVLFEDYITYADFYGSEYDERIIFATKEEAEAKLKEMQDE